MRLRFTKMHGLGNDFVMIDAVTQKFSISPEKVKIIADRKFGIGCDQVLIVEPPTTPEADFCYRIFNCDGSEVENCGNGARCFAIFVRQRGLTVKRKITVETAKGLLVLHVHEDNQVTVDMGVPVLQPREVPFAEDTYQVTYPLTAIDTEFAVSAVSMGNPHCVTVVENVTQFNVAKYGPVIETHEKFPAKVNAGFMEILSTFEAKLRVHERGAGETLACGTGACAAMVAGRLRGLLDEQAYIHLPGGTLTISWKGEGASVFMKGPATTVFHGQVTL